MFKRTVEALKSLFVPPAPKTRADVVREMDALAQAGVNEALHELGNRMNTVAAEEADNPESWFRIAHPKVETDVSSRLGKKYSFIIPNATKRAFESGFDILPIESYCLVSGASQGVIQCIATVTTRDGEPKLRRKLTVRHRFAPEAGAGASTAARLANRCKVTAEPFFRAAEDA